MFDAHLHLRDQRILPYHRRFVKDALDAGVTACIDCTTRPEEWAAEVKCSLEVTSAYGVHPWYSGLLAPDWLDALREVLARDSRAVVGEVGLDGIRKIADDGVTQRTVLADQLALAVRMERPVVFHGARAWVPLFRTLESWADRLPALFFHGVSFSVECLSLPLLRRRNVWFGVGGGLLTPGARALPSLVPALPLDRLLVETDSPDMFPVGGEPLVLGQLHALYNQPGNLRMVIDMLSSLRGIPFAELVEITEANARAFLAARTA